MTTRSYRRWSKLIDAKYENAEIRRALKAILAVEMSARPRPARAIEFIALLVLTALSPLLPQARRRAQRLTVGPLQVRRGGFRFRNQLAVAAALIEDVRGDLSAIARQYNGSATRQRGSALAYEDALAAALSTHHDRA